jgi:hypothetical protein
MGRPMLSCAARAGVEPAAATPSRTAQSSGASWRCSVVSVWASPRCPEPKAGAPQPPGQDPCPGICFTTDLLMDSPYPGYGSVPSPAWLMTPCAQLHHVLLLNTSDPPGGGQELNLHQRFLPPVLPLNYLSIVDRLGSHVALELHIPRRSEHVCPVFKRSALPFGSATHAFQILDDGGVRQCVSKDVVCPYGRR